MHENDIAYVVIGKALELHKSFGPGLLESVYQNALAYDLREMGLKVETEVSVAFEYKGVKQDVGFRIDLLVEDKVLIELKSVEKLAPVHKAQTLTYLKVTGLKLGLLFNFNSVLLKDNIHRLVNKL